MRWMLSAALVALGLPALAPAQQQNEAEKLFRAMEKQVREAKAIKVVFSVDGNLGKDMKVTAKGSVIVAEGNKARVELNAKQGDKDFKLQMYADGKVMGTLIDGKSGGKPSPVEPAMSEAISQITTRGGIFVGMESSPEPGEKQKFDIEKFLPASDFKLGKKEMVNGREAQVVTCTLKPRNGPALQMTVWLATKGNLPIKRELKASDKDAMLDVTENYSEFTLNPSLDAKIFEVPKQ